MKLISGMLFLIILFSTGEQSTQATIWFWAWRSYDLDVEKAEDQRGEVLAFTPDGTVNILLEDVFPIGLQRMDDSHAFVTGKTGDTYSLYYIDSTQAIHVIELFDQRYADEFRSYVLYNVFTPQIIPAGEEGYLIADTRRDRYAIFDTVQHTTTILDLHGVCQQDCVRVSADGRYIRYRASPSESSENALPYQLYEYDILTRTNRLIYEQETMDFVEGVEVPPQIDCTPDQYGDRWYCTLFLDDENNPIWVADEKIIVHVDGSIEPVNSEWQLRVFANKWYFLDLDRRPRDCDPCAINVFPNGNEAESFQFIVPQNLPGWHYQSDMLSEYHLIPNPTVRTLYALSRSGELIEFGVRPCCADPISQDYYDEEMGWMVVINISDLSNAHTELWSTRPLEHIASFSGNVQPGVRSTFRDYSLVLFEEMNGYKPAAIYSYLDETLYEFNFTEERSYIDAFPGGLLFIHYSNDYWLNYNHGTSNTSIYLWTPAEGETLLIEGAAPVRNGW